MVKSIITPAYKLTDLLNVGGISIAVLASKADTGSYEVFHAVGTEGSGPGPHHHPWDESLFITKGEVQCGVDDEEILASPGAFVNIPAGSVHWFRCAEDGSEFITVTSSRNASDMFADFHRGVNWESSVREALISLAARHGQVVIDK